jgi:hypothetical protein
MTDETEFIRDELKKRGFPLESYVERLLTDSGWHVNSNVYFMDKESNKARELDIEANFDKFAPSTWTMIVFNLLIQCKRLPGNAWVFFSHTSESKRIDTFHKCDLTDFLRKDDKWSPLKFAVFDLEIFGSNDTHVVKRDAVATNYCEIIIDEEKSNKRTDNIWKSAVTLVKAVSQELDKSLCSEKQYLDEDLESGAFLKKPFDVAEVFFPIIVFEGKMYEATLLNDDVRVQKVNYVQLRVDYESGHYKRDCVIDVVTRDRFSSFMNDVVNDFPVFDKRRVEVGGKYESEVLEAVKRHYARTYKT